MLDLPLHIGVAPPAQAGIVLIRPAPEDYRGVLLLNLAETWTRIRFLPGYRSASFFVDPAREVVAEYVQWDSADHIAAAFLQPAFAEHLPVNAAMAPHPLIAFGTTTDLLTLSSADDVELASANHSMTVLSCNPHVIDTVRAAVARHYRPRLRGELDAVVVHADAEAGRIGVLAAGYAPVIAPPALDGVEAAIVEHLPTLRRYATVPVGCDRALALHYVMAPHPADAA